MPWPIGRLPIDEPEYFSRGGTMPRSSPGMSEPVGRPKPNFSTQPLKRSAPSFMPMVIAPTLLDWARISAVVSVTEPRSWDSPIVRSATWMVGARPNEVLGVTTLSSSAPATVKALKVEPGS